MDGKQAKKLRKLYRNECKKLGKQGYGLAMQKIARMRDVIFIIAVCEGIAIVVLSILLVLK